MYQITCNYDLIIKLRKIDLAKAESGGHGTKTKGNSAGPGGGLGGCHYIHHRNCQWHKSLLALRSQRITSFCGMLEEMKDRICGSQKLVNDVHILHCNMTFVSSIYANTVHCFMIFYPGRYIPF